MIQKIAFRASIAPIMSGIRTGGDGLRLTLDIPETDVQDAVALIALRNCPLKITVKVDSSPVATRIERPSDRPEKEKPDKGEYGDYWQSLFKAGFQNFPALWEVLKVDKPGEVREALHEHLGCASLTTISPDVFELWLGGHSARQL